MKPVRSTLLSFLIGLLLPIAGDAQIVDEGSSERLVTKARAAPGKAPDLAQVSLLVVEQTNAFRKDKGRAALAVNPKLSEAARYFADYLARTNQFSHTADGNRPWDRAKKFGYDYCIVAENIAYEYSSAGFAVGELATAFVQGWEHSPGHRKNMLDTDVTELGVAVARSPETGYYYAVQEFGRPKSLQLEFQVTNAADVAIRYEVADRAFPLPPHYTRTHELCRPVPVAFRLGDGDAAEKTTVRPAAGAHLVITRDSAGHLQVKKD